jgi:membrane protease YdiL (CAAX protease family)
MYPLSQLSEASLRLLIIAVPVAIVNGICEETLWHRVVVRIFPDNLLLAVIYPAVGFPAENSVWIFVLSTFFLGVSYGWIVYRTRSVKWPVISHSLGVILSLGGAIAPSIHTLLSR